MNKDTYNSLKKIIKEVADEAWEKYYDTAKSGEIGSAVKYIHLYDKVYLLDVYLKDLIEEEENKNE